MSNTRFDVVFYGEILENYNIDRVKNGFAKLFSLSEDHIEKIFNGGRTTLKRNVDSATARRYLQALARIGAKVKLEPQNTGFGNKRQAIKKTQPAPGSKSAAKSGSKSESKKGAATRGRENKTPRPGVGKRPDKQYSGNKHKVSHRQPTQQSSASPNATAKSPAPDRGISHSHIDSVHGIPQGLEQGNYSAAEAHAEVEYLDKVKHPFQFAGNGLDYFRLWLVDWLLTLLTIGIYSPWAKVRCKQYFYNNSRLEDIGFEYLGNPVSILKGRVIVMGFIIVWLLLSDMHPLLGVLMGLVSLVFFPWLLVRVLTFNARNSAYRNIRFNFDGSVSEAGKAFIVWPLLALVSAGVLAPRALYEQHKFIVQGHLYGTERFACKTAVQNYYSLVIVAISVIVAAAVASVLTSMVLGRPAQPPLVALAVVACLYVCAYFAVQQTNLRFNTTVLGKQRFRARMDFNSYTALFLTNLLAQVFTLGLFTPWAKVRMARYKSARISFVSAGELDDYIAQKHLQVGVPDNNISGWAELEIGM